MYCGQFILWATMTVSWLAIPARNTSAFVAAWLRVFLPATHILALKWLMARSTMVLIFIEGNPFIGIPLDAGEHAEVHVFISVSGASFFSRAAGFRTATDPLPFYHVYFRADPFATVRTAFFMAVSGVFHVQGAVFGAGGVAVSVIADFFKRAFIPGVIRDKGSGKMKFILKEAVSFDGVKGGIAKESIRAEPRVERKEIREGRL